MYRWQIYVWKMCSMSYVIRELQIKTTMWYYYISTRIAKIEKNGQCQMLVRTRSNRNSHSLLVGMQNGTAPLEESLAASYKTIQTLNSVIQQLHYLVFTEMSWKLCPHKNLPMNVHSIFIYNCRNFKATKMSFNRSKDKQTGYRTIEYYSATKRNEFSIHER